MAHPVNDSRTSRGFGSTRPGLALLLAFLGVALSFLAASAYSQYRARVIDSAALAIAEDTSPSIEELAAARAGLRNLEVALAQSVLAVDAGGTFDDHEIRAIRREVDGHVHAFLKLRILPGEDALWTGVEQAIADLDREIDDVALAIQAGDLSRAAHLVQTEVRPSGDRVSAVLLDTIAYDAEYSQQAATAIHAARQDNLVLAMILDTLCLLASIFAAVVVRRVTRSYSDLLEARNQLLGRQAEELEAFAGTVAHDILSPLNAVSLAHDLILTRTQVDGDAKALVLRARTALGRTKLLVHDLLEFARSGAKPTPGAHASIAEVVTGVVQELSPRAEEVGASIRIDVGTGGYAACPPGVLTSLVGNLLRNSLAHVANRPVKEIGVRAFASNGHVRVEVADSGPGLAAELQEVIFLPHVRGPDVGHDGLGLGLATVSRLTKAHGGAVGVQSQLDRGSTFWFELPSATA
jgi:signal transduction histidine kinase